MQMLHACYRELDRRYVEGTLERVHFELTEDDREQVRGLDGGKSIILDHHDLEKVEWLLGYFKGSMDAAE